MLAVILSSTSFLVYFSLFLQLTLLDAGLSLAIRHTYQQSLYSPFTQYHMMDDNVAGEVCYSKF